MPNRVSAEILLVDDEELIRQTIAEYLESEGFRVETCGSAEAALELVRAKKFDVALCDVNLPAMDGIELLQRMLQVQSDLFVLLITAYATVESAVEAFQNGAQDYLMKPIILDEVAAKIRRLLRIRELSLENQLLRRELNQIQSVDGIIGNNAEVRKIYELAKKVAPTKSTVLITGESGTGKEVLARYVHQNGRIAPAKGDSRFIAVNCAAIPGELLENQLFGHRKGAFTGADRDQPGVFVHAGYGTVFLDEIGEMPLVTQAKLLRAIEQKEIFPVGANEPIHVEARIIAATNKDLAKEVSESRFREDLFYRLNVVAFKLPPLRDRREDIPELVQFFLDKHVRSMGKSIRGITHEATQCLLMARWKGNIRELDNALQRAVILSDGPFIQPEDLPADLAPCEVDPSATDDLNDATARFEKLHIERILKRYPDKRDAAKTLGIALSSLYRKIELLNIQM